ncbi:hypothetical protein QZH41_016370 [Actinostola sp. cb2023]|nr:hypothetical protein QZH41_016370 [Actinostola sp. cb2023]
MPSPLNSISHDHHTASKDPRAYPRTSERLTSTSVTNKSGQDRKGAWGDPHGLKSPGLLAPTADRLGGSVQVVSSTNGDLGPNEDPRMDGKLPLNNLPEVEVVEETKCCCFFKRRKKKKQPVARHK